MSFYVTLPSNASIDVFPHNTATNYTTSLQMPLRFDTQYEVGLVEMVYNHNWTNNIGKLSLFLENKEYF